MNFKINLQTIIMFILLGFSILFFSMWFLKGTGYKKEYKKLEQEFQKIQKIRESQRIAGNHPC